MTAWTPEHRRAWTSARLHSREMMREDACNDNMSEADRRALRAWAEERMQDAAWRSAAVSAMWHAQAR